MKISVIMGVYNCKSKEMLFDSINSIINQTYKDWEFIICNDGSTNNTLELLKEAEQLDKRIKIISYEKNRGLSNALNECLKHAKGEYIARQDDDDISYPDRLQKEVEFLDNNIKYSIVGTIADVYNENGIWGEYLVDEYPTRKSFLWNSPFIHPTIMVRKEAYDAVGGYRFAKETRRCEDYDLFMRMYAKGFLGYNIQEKLFKYRLDNDPNKKYRPMKCRMEEACVRYKGYKQLRLMPAGMVYVIKPIAVGLIPARLISAINKKKF